MAVESIARLVSAIPLLSPEELSAVDDFRFKQRMPSRAAAVRELFRLGLTNAGLTLVKNGKKWSDFGVLEDGIKGRRKRETPASNILAKSGGEYFCSYTTTDLTASNARCPWHL